MNTSYQKSTKINIFHAHTFLYICIYVYILHANITGSKYSHYETGSGCRKLIGAIQVWQLTMRVLGNTMYALERQQRGCKKRWGRGYEQFVVRLVCHCHRPLRGGWRIRQRELLLRVLPKNRSDQGGGSRFRVGCWCGAGGLRVSNGGGKGKVEWGKRQKDSVQKDIAFAFQRGHDVCMRCQRDGGFLLLYSLE